MPPFSPPPPPSPARGEGVKNPPPSHNEVEGVRNPPPSHNEVEGDICPLPPGGGGLGWGGQRSTPFRIAFFGSSTAPDGGSELRLLEMVTHFRQNHSVTLFLPDAGPLSQLAADAGVEVVNLNFLRLRRHHGWNWIRWAASVLRARRQLARELLERRIQIVHFNDFIDLPFYSVPARLGIPAITHLRLIVAHPLVRKIYRNWVRWTGTMVVPVSMAVRREMLGTETKIPHRLIHDPRPDPALFHPDRSGVEKNLRDSWGWSGEDFVVVMLSKLLENKGHLPFLSAAMELAGDSDIRYRFLMIARPSPGREPYQEQVLATSQQLPRGSFQWLPGAPHTEIPVLLRASDYFLHLPETEDSFPGVVLEAMACGLPVVAYEAGGIPEQLEDGHAGVLVPRGDWKGVATAVRELAKNPERRKSLIHSARQRLDTEYSRERFFEQIEGVYLERVGSSPVVGGFFAAHRKRRP